MRRKMLGLLHMLNGVHRLGLTLALITPLRAQPLERPHGGQREPLGNTNERGAHGRVTQHTYNSTDCLLSEHDIASIVQVISTSASTVCTVRFTISPVVSSWYLLLMATTWACRLGRATPRLEIRGQGVKIPFRTSPKSPRDGHKKTTA
jgi:hypothetical protein